MTSSEPLTNCPGPAHRRPQPPPRPGSSCLPPPLSGLWAAQWTVVPACPHQDRAGQRGPHSVFSRRGGWQLKKGAGHRGRGWEAQVAALPPEWLQPVRRALVPRARASWKYSHLHPAALRCPSAPADQRPAIAQPTFLLDGEVLQGAHHRQFPVGNAAVSLRSRRKPLTALGPA